MKVRFCEEVMESQPVRILHVLDQLSVNSGVSNVAMGYVRNIDPSKFIVDIAVYMPSDDGLIREIETRSGKVHQLPEISFPFASAYCASFAKILEQESYPIIHGHLPTAAFLFLKEAKRKAVPNRIIHAHSCGVDGFAKQVRNRILMSMIPRYANHYVSCSNAATDYVYGKSTKPKVHLILNGIEPTRFHFSATTRNEMRNALGIKEDDLCVGHVGRITSIKNHSFLLNAFNELLQSGQRAKLVLVGEGELQKAVEQQIKELNIEQVVHLVGKTDTVENYYQAFDQFWFPSLKEGWGVAGLEAQCAGLPCLFSKSIPREINIVKENVQFLSIDNPSEWAETSRHIGKIVRQDVTQAIYDSGFDITTQIKRLESIYTTMMGS